MGILLAVKHAGALATFVALKAIFPVSTVLFEYVDWPLLPRRVNPIRVRPSFHITSIHPTTDRCGPFDTPRSVGPMRSVLGLVFLVLLGWRIHQKDSDAEARLQRIRDGHRGHMVLYRVIL